MKFRSHLIKYAILLDLAYYIQLLKLKIYCNVHFQHIGMCVEIKILNVYIVDGRSVSYRKVLSKYTLSNIAVYYCS